MLLTLLALLGVLAALSVYYVRHGRVARKGPGIALAPEAPIVELATLSTTVPVVAPVAAVTAAPVAPPTVYTPEPVPVPVAAPSPAPTPRPAAPVAPVAPEPVFATVSPYGQASVQQGRIGLLASADDDPVIQWRTGGGDDYMDFTTPGEQALVAAGPIALGHDSAPIAWSAVAD